MILFFYGDNDFAMRREVERVREHYVKKSGGDMSLEVFDLSETGFDNLLRSVAAVPLFASSRLIIVRGLSKNTAAASKIEQLLKNVSPTTVVIFEERAIDKRSKVFKTLSKLPAKNVRQFKVPTADQVVRWVIDEVKRRGGQIDMSTAKKLCEQVGIDQWQLEQEIIKLLNYDTTITSQNINLLVVPNTSQTIFMLIDAVAEQNLTRALELYHQLGRDGVADQQILAMFNWHFRNLALAYDNIGSGLNWAKTFGVSPFAAGKADQLARRLDGTEIGRAYRLIVEADYAIKTGVKSSQAALEDLIYQLAN